MLQTVQQCDNIDTDIVYQLTANAGKLDKLNTDHVQMSTLTQYTGTDYIRLC